MCSRFTLTRSRDQLEERLGVAAGALRDYSPRYNIAPTQDHFVMVIAYENCALIAARWGLVPARSKDATRASQSINARCETIQSRPTFREAFRRRRCIVPAGGFYEWTGPRSQRQPLWIHRRDGQLILFPGVYEEWTPPRGNALTTFAILTCAANSAIARIHDRMPVILSDRDADDWMNPREADPLSLRRMLVPAADGLLEMRPASPLVNSVDNEGPELLSETGRTGSLF